MRRALPFCLLLCLPIAAQEAPIPTATDLPGSPFFIKKTWFIGGVGNWDYITIDPAARRLYIAHAATVQVVDIDAGAVVAEIHGFREAHSIALDDTGTHGYVSDGPADEIKKFDRRSFQIESTIPISCSPRSIAFEPVSKLLFAICGAGPASPDSQRVIVHKPSTNAHAPRPGENPQPVSGTGTSHVVAIDTETNRVVADIVLVGDFRFAQPDGNGQVYVSVGAVLQDYVRDHYQGREYFSPRIAKLDGPAIAAEAERHREAPAPQAQTDSETLSIDWSHQDRPNPLVHFMPLNPSCTSPQGLAADSKDQRLFITCENQRFEVIDANSGASIATLVTGPGNDTVGYDQDRGLIFIANGAGYGSVTIIRQDANTDSFAVIQNLPTRGGARTIAVDSSTGEAYLVTDFQGVDLTKAGGIGSLRAVSVPGSFQVLVIGH
ncbi:MAG TPA: hypothetical protein VGG45_07020 [Terracidiphilus sp.]|jgi:hypothetical protein